MRQPQIVLPPLNRLLFQLPPQPQQTIIFTRYPLQLKPQLFILPLKRNKPLPTYLYLPGTL